VQQKKPGAHVLIMIAGPARPLYAFNHYGASDAFIAKDRALLVDAIAAMIEANRAILPRTRTRIVPAIMRRQRRSRRTRSRFAIDVADQELHSVGQRGFRASERSEWTHQNNINTGDLEADKKVGFEQIADLKLATEAVEKAGGRQTIGTCKDRTCKD